jgi:TolA-binding protein
MRKLCGAALLAALGLTVLAPAYAADTLRPEIGKPLEQAEELMKGQKYKEALTKVNEAEAVSNKTPYESFIVERMRGAAAAGAGEVDVAAQAFDTVIASGKLQPEEQQKIMMALTSSYYRAKDYPKAEAWAQRYLKAGGADPVVERLLTQSYYLSGDYADAAHALQAELSADEKSGKAPAEDELQMLADSELRQNDSAGCTSALEELVSYYPKKEYWAQVLSRVPRKPGFSDRLSLDVYRLKLATGNLTTAADFMELAQLALQAGYPAEAKKAMEQGFASGVLGTGPEAERQKRLRDLAARQFADDQKVLAAGDPQAAKAPDGGPLVNSGYNYVLNGQYDKGIALIEQGIAKGQLKHAEDAKLHLGMAYLLAGRKDEAVKVLKTVQGADGTQDLARLWAVQARHA